VLVADAVPDAVAAGLITAGLASNSQLRQRTSRIRTSASLSLSLTVDKLLVMSRGLQTLCATTSGYEKYKAVTFSLEYALLCLQHACANS